MDRYIQFVSLQDKWLGEYQAEKKIMNDGESESGKRERERERVVTFPTAASRLTWTDINWNDFLNQWIKSIESTDQIPRLIAKNRQEIERMFYGLFGSINHHRITLDKQFLILLHLAINTLSHSVDSLFYHNIGVIVLHSPLPVGLRARFLLSLRHTKFLPIYGRAPVSSSSHMTTKSHANDDVLARLAWKNAISPALQSMLRQTWIETIWFRQQELKTKSLSFPDVVSKVARWTEQKSDEVKILLEQWPSALQSRLVDTHRQVGTPALSTVLEVVLTTAHYDGVLDELTQTQRSHNTTIDRLAVMWFPVLVETSDTRPAQIWQEWLKQPLSTLPTQVHQRLTTKDSSRLKQDILQWASLVHLHSIGNVSQLRRAVTLMYFFLHFHPLLAKK